MKTKFLALAFLAATAWSAGAITTIAQWTFEAPNTPANVTNAATYPNLVSPTFGSGNASGVHSSSGTDWTTPVGNGSAESWSANEWAIGDYFQFSLSTVGYHNIQVSWDQTGSGTGPRDFKLQYSTGSSFTDVAGYTVLQNLAVSGGGSGLWNETTSIPAYAFSFNLSSITAIEDETLVYFRLVNTSTVSVTGGTVGAGGTSRIDNFTITGSAIPDTGASALLLALPLLGLWVMRQVSLKAEG